MAQLKHLRPDVVVKDVRGNVDTRIRKLDAGDFDALILACAGLRRLGLENRITGTLFEMFPPLAREHSAWRHVQTTRTPLQQLRNLIMHLRSLHARLSARYSARLVVVVNCQSRATRDFRMNN